MKKCPYCAEVIQDAAIVCRFCGRDLVKPSLETIFTKRVLPIGVVILIVAIVVLFNLNRAQQPATRYITLEVYITPTPMIVSIYPTNVSATAAERAQVIPQPEPTSTTELNLEPGAVSWETAGDYAGDRKTICGPVVGANYAFSTSGQPTFLNIGKTYPEPGRFTVIIWNDNRGRFPFPPEEQYLDKTICVHGLVEIYRGEPQIEAVEPSQIEIY